MALVNLLIARLEEFGFDLISLVIGLVVGDGAATRIKLPEVRQPID